MAALLIVLLGGGARGRAAEWRVPGARARVPISVHTGFHPRTDDVVEIALDQLPQGVVRVLGDRELPTFRDQSAGVLRILLTGSVPAYEDIRLMAYFGGKRAGDVQPDDRLTRPRRRNLIANGGFEQGLTHWTVPEDKRLTATVGAGRPHRGSKCLHLEFDGKSGSILSAKFPVTPGTLLTLRAWARVALFQRPKPHIGSPVRVLVELYDETGNRVDRFSTGWSVRSVTSNWRLMHGWRRVPPGACTGQVHIRNWWCKSIADLDSIEVSVFQPPPCDVTVGQAQTR